MGGSPSTLPSPATLPEPPLASAMAIPPSAETETSVTLETLPPSTRTLPWVLPMPIVLPTLPPLLISPTKTVPPCASALAKPPLPALAEFAELQKPPTQLAMPQQASSKPQRLPSYVQQFRSPS